LHHFLARKGGILKWAKQEAELLGENKEKGEKFVIK